MAPRIPHMLDAEIFQRINSSIASGIAISELELQSLINKTNNIKIPYRYACLSALYSHAMKYDLTIENATKSIVHSDGEQCCIENAISALSNIKLFQEIVDLSKKYPVVLNYSDSLKNCYEAALYCLDLDYCESLSSTYKHAFSCNDAHHQFREFFGGEQGLLTRGAEYLLFAVSRLRDVLKKFNTRVNTIWFGLVNDPKSSSLLLNVNFLDISIDKVIEMEDEWNSLIAHFEITDDLLCDFSFSMEVQA